MPKTKQGSLSYVHLLRHLLFRQEVNDKTVETEELIVEAKIKVLDRIKKTFYLLISSATREGSETFCLKQLENCLRSRIEIPPNAFLPLTLTFSPRKVMVMFHTHAKGQGQRSLS